MKLVIRKISFELPVYYIFNEQRANRQHPERYELLVWIAPRQEWISFQRTCARSIALWTLKVSVEQLIDVPIVVNGTRDVLQLSSQCALNLGARGNRLSTSWRWKNLKLACRCCHDLKSQTLFIGCTINFFKLKSAISFEVRFLLAPLARCNLMQLSLLRWTESFNFLQLDLQRQ